MDIADVYPIKRFLAMDLAWIIVAAGLYFGKSERAQVVPGCAELLLVVAMVVALPTLSMSTDDPDFDGVYFSRDLCPDSDQYFWEEVDINGCSFSQYDLDGDGDIDNDDDGVFDCFDKCPGTEVGADVDRHGCAT
ncbi:MAG TPA: hypothetical protein EYQ80_06810 [Candidatus Poseidoniales archaeon]|nr:hypothetical protein [Candidatus Poseidoniales archaeon]